MSYPTYMPGAYMPNTQGYGPMQPYPPRGDMQGMGQQVQQMQPQQPQPSIQGLSGASRPVTSREEATGVAADFSGSLMVFPDIAHNRVYLKRWNMNTGSADFVEYAPVVQAQPEQKQDEPAVAYGKGFLG